MHPVFLVYHHFANILVHHPPSHHVRTVPLIILQCYGIHTEPCCCTFMYTYVFSFFRRTSAT